MESGHTHRDEAPRVVMWLRRRLLAGGLRMAARAGKTRQATRLGNKRRPVLWTRGAHARMRRFGTTFHLNLDDNAQRLFYYTGWYERPFLEFLAAELRPSDVYVDVGAHVGIDAAFAARQCARVVAFEAGPDTAAELERNVERLGNVMVVPQPLGDEMAVRELRANPNYHPDDHGTRSLYGEGDIAACVSVMPFDSWADRLPGHRMDLVKIDVEGAELDVLLGMRDSLRRLRPRVVAVELNHLDNRHDTVHELLEDCGYVYERTIIENAIFRQASTGANE